MDYTFLAQKYQPLVQENTNLLNAFISFLKNTLKIPQRDLLKDQKPPGAVKFTVYLR